MANEKTNVILFLSLVVSLDDYAPTFVLSNCMYITFWNEDNISQAKIISQSQFNMNDKMYCNKPQPCNKQLQHPKIIPNISLLKIIQIMSLKVRHDFNDFS